MAKHNLSKPVSLDTVYGHVREIEGGLRLLRSAYESRALAEQKEMDARNILPNKPLILSEDLRFVLSPLRSPGSPCVQARQPKGLFQKPSWVDLVDPAIAANSYRSISRPGVTVFIGGILEISYNPEANPRTRAHLYDSSRRERAVYCVSTTKLIACSLEEVGELYI